jgi:hypothetical protein
MYDAQTLIDRAEARKLERSGYDTEWRKSAKLIRLLRDDFGRKGSPGEARGEMVYDSTPIYAADNLAAGIFGMMTNPANVWFLLETDDEDLNRFQSVRIWLDIAGAKCIKSFGPSVSSFYNAVPQLYGDEAAFGMGVFYSAEMPGTGRFQDVCRALSEVFVAVNQFDEIDTVDRMFDMNARAIAQQFGIENLPDKIKTAANDKPDTMFPMLHAVLPNEDFREGAIGPKGKAFLSSYIALERKSTLEEGGYHELPYQIPRWSVASGEKYGRGPAMNAMGDIKMLQAMNRTLIQTAERGANPSWLAPNEGQISVLRTAPGKVTFGGVSRTGAQLVHPLQSGANITVSLEMIDRVREQVRDAFFFSVMQLLGRTGMTATEVVTRQEEKMRLMGPHLGRIESEFLSPLIRRRFNMLWRAGQLPPPPPELAGRRIQVRYESPMAKAQKSAEGVATMRFLEGANAIAAFDPSAAKRLDGSAALRVLQDAFGAPARLLLSDEAFAARMQQEAQQQQLMGGLDAGGRGAEIVSKLAAAAKNAGVLGQPGRAA